jgi:hypothetical protein
MEVLAICRLAAVGVGDGLRFIPAAIRFQGIFPHMGESAGIMGVPEPSTRERMRIVPDKFWSITAKS